MTKRSTFPWGGRALALSAIALATLALLALLVGVSVAQETPAQDEPSSNAPSDFSFSLDSALVATAIQQTPQYTVSQVAYNWVEIGGGGPVDLTGDNWGSDPVSIGFLFPFYEGLYNEFRVSTNGYIYFGGSQEDGAAVPNAIGFSYPPNNFIAPFGTDLYFAPGVSEVYVDQQTSPEVRTVIQFEDVQWCCGLNDPHTFEIILYPDGRILTQYRRIRYLSDRNAYVVAGIEDASGGNGAAYYQDWFVENDALGNQMAVLYDPGSWLQGHLILQPAAQTWWDDPGQTADLAVRVGNWTGFTRTFGLSYTHFVSSAAPGWVVNLPPTLGPISSTDSDVFQAELVIPAGAAWSDLARLDVTVLSTAPFPISGTVVMTYGVAQRDLGIIKTLYPEGPPTAPPGPGGEFRYRITVSNDDYPGSGRAGQARGVVVTDTLPAQAEFLDSSDPDNVTLTPDGFVWEVGELGAYGDASLVVEMRVPGGVSVGTAVVNSADTSMLASRERGPFDNNTDTYSFNVATPQTAFELSKSFPGANVIAPGQVATFTVSAANVGNVPASDLELTDVLPPGTTFHGTTWPDWSGEPEGPILFDLGTLPNGGWNGVSFDVGVEVPIDTPIGTWLTNTVQLQEFQGESDQEAIEVFDPQGDVWVIKYPEESSPGVPVVPEPGGDYTFWINYGNAGSATVSQITLTDTLPISYVTLLEASPADGADPITSTPGLVVWSIDDLAPGQDDWVQMRVLIAGNTPDGAQLVNTAEITAAQGGNINPLNDSSRVTLTLEAADVTVNKSVVPSGTLQVGDWVTYTLRFSNTGVFPAYGVRLEDVRPDRLSGVSWQASGHSLELLQDEPPRLLWRTLEPLGAGDLGVITLTGQLDPAATWPPQLVLTNTATIRSYQAEPPDGDPNVAVVTNTVLLASPYVRKTGPTLALPGDLVTYDVAYGNLGTLPAQGVRLTDTLPANTTYVSDTSGLTVTSGAGWVAWEAGTLSPTTDLQFSLVLSLSPGTPIGAGLYNTLEITSATYDGDRGDNRSTWLTSVGYDLYYSYKLINGQSWAEVGWGLPVTYTVVLTNGGPYDAPLVQLWDTIPTHTAYIAGSLAAPSGSYGYDPAAETITWTGAVSGNTAISVTFQVTVAPGGPLPRGTVIRNTALISDGVRGLAPSVTATITGPDLSPSFKTVDEPRPPSGEMITYTISLFNDGEVEATARLTDSLPAEVLYSGGGWASSGSLGGGDPITWAGVVPINGYVTITLPVIVVAGPGSSFTNTATIADGTGVVVERSVRVDTQAPDFDVPGTYKTASELAVFNGERVTYTIAIYNGGDAPAPSVHMTDTLQGGTYLGGGGASGGTFDDSGAPTILWNGALGVGGSVVITIPVVISATPGSDVPNLAYLDDGYGTVISRSIYVHVNRPPDISNSSKGVDQPQARAGEVLLYSLTVDNSGDVPTAFAVTDTLDPRLSFAGFLVTPTGALQTAGTISWTGTISGQSQAQLIFWAAIDRAALGTITNTAYFADASGRFYTSTVATLIREPALSAIKRAEPAGLIQPGTLLAYTIVLHNVGEVRTEVNLTDTIPAHTAYQYGSAQVSPAYYNPPLYISPTLVWEDEVEPGETVTLTFDVRVSAELSQGMAITNTAWLKRSGGLPFSVSAANGIGQLSVYLPVVIKGD